MLSGGTSGLVNSTHGHKVEMRSPHRELLNRSSLSTARKRLATSMVPLDNTRSLVLILLYPIGLLANIRALMLD